MLIHVTQKPAEKLKITPETATAADPFYSWRANYAQDGGQRFVAFMNDETRFAVVITFAVAAKLKKLDELFVGALRGALLELSVNPDVIDRYIAELPILIEGNGDAHPEDVGGQGGFANFLEIIADPEDKEYTEMTARAKSQRWKRFDFAETARTLHYRLQN